MAMLVKLDYIYSENANKRKFTFRQIIIYIIFGVVVFLVATVCVVSIVGFTRKKGRPELTTVFVFMIVYEILCNALLSYYTKIKRYYENVEICWSNNLTHPF